MKFTISSGPFNVPIVEHVIVAMGDTPAEAKWNWLVLRNVLFDRIPGLEKTRSYSMASEYDRESHKQLVNVLVYFRCDEKILKDICREWHGQYLTPEEVIA
ncbi:hypothetical protein MettiDRAFT_0823 [Methanolobus tindarius DSM 2278]|uniref:Uncharacterized protein n=1 Tax=Methanolobus tindarius DSM 2278 TaxID=1090322 RepID=W9DN50_METTI|nr:hypothetical protein [Methanolobus tindarius]ETA67399.1 hypothetical protein MettiDRAFT_0823 [Methanolobus tindarius DSM 2278]